MTNRYCANGQLIELHCWNGEIEPRARCQQAEEAARLLNRAADLQEARKYTASARAMYQAEQCEGFYWLD